MLSRVADALYWMSRYLERAENTSRLVDVHLHAMLDFSPSSSRSRWERLKAALRVVPEELPIIDSYRVTRRLTFDTANPDSIVNCVSLARENARQVREQISSEMWEQLNQFYLAIVHKDINDIWQARPHEFFWAVREGAHLFQGITDSTMNHEQGWHFMQLGRFIERATNTAALLSIYFEALVSDPHRTLPADDYLEWVGLLKCFTAFEAYCKVYTADVKAGQVAEFMLLNGSFPRSAHFAADMILSALNAIAEATEASKTGRCNRLAGRLVAALSFTQIDEIMAAGLQAYLTDIQNLCAQIHSAIHQTYITYAVETALPS